MTPDTEKKLAIVYDFARQNPHSSLYARIPEPSLRASFKELWDDLPVVNINAKALEAAEALSHYPQAETRFTISKFGTQNPEEVFLVPHKTDAVWRMLSDEMARVKPATAMLAVSPVWQLGPLFYHTGRAHKVPVSVASPRNLPVAAHLVQEIRTELVVASAATASELGALLQQQGAAAQVKLWHLIVALGEEPLLLNVPGEVSFEYHLFPGYPIAMGERGEGKRFRALPDFYFEQSEAGTLVVTSLACHALPLLRFDTGVKVSRDTRDSSLWALA